MKRAVVSVITPCYRMGKYLRLFLERLPEQTLFDRLEVVLDHNEPSVEEVEWVRAFQKRYPGKLKHFLVERVDPIGVSMNRCIRKAQADLVTIWNVDDLRTPNSIEAQTDLLSRAKTDIVYGNYWVVSAFGKTAGDLVTHEAIPVKELTRSMILGPFFMFRKDLCKRAGLFDEQLRSGADFDLAVRLAFHGQARATQTPLGYYLNEGLGASTRPNSLQPVERTVIELRYGIYDKIDYRFVAKASRYNIPHLLYQGAWRPVKRFVPAYDRLMEERYEKWHAKGLQRFVRRSLVEGTLLWEGARRLKRAARKWVT